jgi:hypothetical protein
MLYIKSRLLMTAAVLRLKWAVTLPRLASIRPPAFDLLVAAQTGAERDVDAWRSGEAEAFGYFDEIQFVYVEDRAQTVRGVCLEVGAVSVFGGLFGTLAGVVRD